MSTAILKLRLANGMDELREALAEPEPEAPNVGPEPPGPGPLLYEGLVETISPIIEALEAGIDEFRKIQSAWEGVAEKSDDAAVVTAEFIAAFKSLDCEATIRAARGKLRELQKKRVEWRVRQRAAAQQVPAPAAAPPAAAVDRPRIPPVKIQPFNGERDRWVEFWDAYNSLVHQGTQPAVQKLAYLKQLLQGEAKDVLTGLPLTEANYAVAIQTLQDRFADPEAAIQELTRKLDQLSAGRDFSTVKRFQANLHMLCQQLEVAGEAVNGVYYLQKFESKLPPAVLREIWKCKKDVIAAGRLWTVTEFRKALQEYVVEEEKIQKATEDQRPKTGSASAEIPVTAEPKPFQRKPWVRAELPRARPWNRERVDQPTINFTASERPGAVANHYPFAARSPALGSNREPVVTTFNRRVQAVVRQATPAIRASLNCAFCRSAEHASSRCNVYPDANARAQQAAQRRLCACCLSEGHVAQSCPRKDSLKCFSCQGAHFQFMCPSRVRVFGGPREMASSAITGECTLMMCAHVEVFHPNAPAQTRMILCFVDTGSTRSYVSRRLARLLRLNPGMIDVISVGRFRDSQTHTFSSERRRLGIKLDQGEEQQVVLNEVEEISRELLTVPLTAAQRDQLVHHAIQLPVVPAKPDLLLGIRHFKMLQLSDAKELANGFTLWSSRIGPLICGEGELPGESGFELATMAMESPPDELNETMTRYLEQESGGLGDHTGATASATEDQMALEGFKKSLKMVDTNDPGEPLKRYQVSLPWLTPRPDLPSNYTLARGRLDSVLRKLRNQPEVLKQYHQIMQDQIRDGILEEVKEPWKETPGPVHYLPHQPVVKVSSSTTKLRIVYDASAKGGRGMPSLNECMARGNVIAGQGKRAIAAILIRFRLMGYVISADLEKAFLQLLLAREDRDVTRLLWVVDLADPNSIRVYRFTRLTFGLKAAPFLLGATIEAHLSKYPSDLARRIEENIYYDNLLIEAQQRTQVLSIVHDSRQIFAAAGFNLRQFSSDCRAELEGLDPELREMKETHSVLGVDWNTVEDTVSITLPTFEDQVVTKRTILSTVASAFDPCGWIAPVILQAKLIQAEIWDPSASWDEKIPTEKAQSWLQLMASWDKVTVTIPRKAVVGRSPESQVEFHAFADASKVGLGAAIYIRMVDPQGGVQTGLLFAKSLIVPRAMKNPKQTEAVSIPRLELQAAVIAAKLLEYTKEATNSTTAKGRIWSDSKTVVEWLNQDRNKQIFVENRLKKLRKYRLSHVEGKQNPADLASRGVEPETLKDLQLWWQGPDWLSEPEDEWPTPIVDHLPFVEVTIEADQSVQFAAVEIVPEQSIQISRYGKLPKAQRVCVYVFRFLKKVIRRTRWKAPVVREIREVVQDSGPISGAEMNFALERLVKLSQGSLLANDGDRLGRYLDEKGLQRCKGRVGWSRELAKEEKFPLYLPRKAPLTTLILREIHETSHHAGPNTMIASLRQRFWVPKARKTIRDVIFTSTKTKCLTCFRFIAKPATDPPEAPLPADRVSFAQPFRDIGTDYFGPMRVRIEGQSEVVKVWGVIFTCHAVRAVHLELVPDCTAEGYLRAFRRFISRRGLPQSVLSDNGTQFVLGAEAIKKIWAEVHADPSVQQFAANHGIKWRFVTEKAPWRGGSYERLIGTVKGPLRRAIGRRTLTREELSTLLTEVESVVNSRPLTFMSEDGIDRPLRPVDFLRPRGREAFGPTVDPIDDSDPDWLDHPNSVERLVGSYQRSISRLEEFHRGFKEDYLLALRERMGKAGKSGKSAEVEVRVGEVVLIHDDELPRSQWRIGRVTELVPSADGVLRTALLRVPPSNMPWRRATRHLYPLELAEDEPFPAGELARRAPLIMESPENEPDVQEDAQPEVPETTATEADQPAEQLISVTSPTRVNPSPERNLAGRPARNRRPPGHLRDYVLLALICLVGNVSAESGAVRLAKYNTNEGPSSPVSVQLGTQLIFGVLAVVFAAVAWRRTTHNSTRNGRLTARPPRHLPILLDTGSQSSYATGIGIRTRAALLTLAMIVCFTGSTEARSPMACMQLAKPTLWRLQNFTASCPLDENDVPPVALKLQLFRPNSDSQNLKASHCWVTKRTYTYWKNLINEEKSSFVEESGFITAEDCTRMQTYQRCAHGTLTDGRTNNGPGFEFSYFFTRTTVVYNCYLSWIKLLVTPGVMDATSAVVDLSHCHLPDGACGLPDGGMVIWDKERLKEGRFCPYAPILGLRPGEIREGVWIDVEREMEVSFGHGSLLSNRTTSCNQKLVVSDQGYAIAEESYNRFRAGVARAGSRKRRQLARSGIVHSEQLASQLSAAAWVAMDDLKSTIRHTVRRMCNQVGDLGRGHHVESGDATLFARKILNDEFVKARWIGQGLFEAWKCAEIRADNLELLPSENAKRGICYTSIRVNFRKAETVYPTKQAYLDPRTLEVTDVTEEAPCSDYRFLTAEIGGQLKRIDQLTGQIWTYNPDVANLLTRTGPVLSSEKLGPHIFHNLIVTEAEDTRREIVNAIRELQTNHRLKAGVMGPQEHPSAVTPYEQAMTLVWGKLDWWTVWVSAAAVYVTAHFLIVHVLPKLLKYGTMGWIPWLPRAAPPRRQVNFIEDGSDESDVVFAHNRAPNRSVRRRRRSLPPNINLPIFGAQDQKSIQSYVPNWAVEWRASSPTTSSAVAVIRRVGPSEDGSADEL